MVFFNHVLTKELIKYIAKTFLSNSSPTRQSFFWLIATLTPAALLGSQDLLAAEIVAKGGQKGQTFLAISGTLRDGDEVTFDAHMRRAATSGIDIEAVELNSGGGAIAVGASIARTVWLKALKTSVQSGATCASACFMIFAAGSERRTGEGARIGVHSAVTPGVGESKDAKAATIDMSRFLGELGVPPLILGKLINTPPDRLEWLTPDDLRLLRVNHLPPVRSKDSYVERAAPILAPLPATTTAANIRRADRLIIEAHSHLRANKLESALALFREARLLNPFDPDAASSYGLALHQSGQNDLAKEVLLLAVNLKPNYPEAHRILTLVSAELGNSNEVRLHLHQYWNAMSHKEIATNTVKGLSKDPKVKPILREAANELLTLRP